MSKTSIENSQVTFPFTVFAFGTGESSEMKEKTIISHFSEACVGAKIVLEGPTLLGTEVNPNAQLAFDAIIKNLADPHCPVLDKYTVNLTGLSRGAVTCVRIANLLKKKERELEHSEIESDKELLTKLKKLELNIFNLDPVAGMGDKMYLESRLIPDNVANYVAILQLDEMRREFKPQDLKRILIESPNKTQVSLLPLYGNHTDTIKVKDADKQSTAQIAQISLYNFLTQHGTLFKKNELPMLAVKGNTVVASVDSKEPRELFSLFRKQHAERDAYLKYGKRSKFGDSAMFRAQRRLNEQREYYVTDSHIFVNQLERELFKVAYPRVFNYFFENNIKDPFFASVSTEHQVIKELKEIKELHPDLFKQLKALGVTDDNDIKIGPPRGTMNLESCRTIGQIYPYLLPEKMTPTIIKERGSLADLKTEVMRVTLRYDVEKASFLTFDERAQSKRTASLRDQINKIYLDPKLNNVEKEHQILDTLERHVLFLTAAKSRSKLLDLLKETLVQHGRSVTPPKDLSNTTELLAYSIHTSLSLVKNTIFFIGSLGFVGGYALSTAGIFLEDMGARMKDAIGKVGNNPLKGLAMICASVLQGFGVILKHNLGLKPMTQIMTEGLRDLRDANVARIRTENIKEEEHPEMDKKNPNLN